MCILYWTPGYVRSRAISSVVPDIALVNTEYSVTHQKMFDKDP